MSWRQLPLFGDAAGVPEAGRTRREVFEDYEGFTAKFKPKLTTDDCYTPPAVYDAVLAHVRERGLLPEGCRPVRPFFPGGDFERFPYGEGDVVVDNPPFSILARIVDFYTARGIGFWLFAPHLTLFGHLRRPVTLVVAAAGITYENGAVVPTDFVTNLYRDDTWVVADGGLHDRLEAADATRPKKAAEKYVYPKNLLTSAYLGNYISSRGGSLTIRRGEGVRVSALDCQKAAGKSVFGGGLLVTDAAAERAAVERAAAERAAAERAAVEWELSERERKMLEALERGKEY